MPSAIRSRITAYTCRHFGLVSSSSTWSTVVSCCIRRE
ncbi:hypothetical protein CPT_Spernnie_050 [Streptomyces phage Spernnie]|uniref:Uncharacterized protein n=1 Tax=Streptomyces phage Spernnie TaxID=2767588 RepID=A0A873WVL7_9CAUD|nr:hypothetical protein KGG74_gp50 [Streptomyces phage Spernnie]QPB09654.1 hypothetical protein CPT_Spernnie_050 [Streptomyces phage Spernnie]